MKTPAKQDPQAAFSIDSRCNLVVTTETGHTVTFAPHAAVALLKFIERTNYRALAGQTMRGALQ